MSYTVKEIFYSIQGEGHNLGKPAVFCRFSKCNLWSGHEKDREKAICKFCDTDFVGGQEFKDEKELANKIDKSFKATDNKFVILTGGEPMLQVDKKLISELKLKGFSIAIETNGTIEVPKEIDWITVSPKLNAKLKQKSGNELKIVYPQDFDLKEFENFDFEHFFLSPMATGSEEKNRKNIEKVVNYCLENSKWRMTYQCHKIWGVR